MSNVAYEWNVELIEVFPGGDAEVVDHSQKESFASCLEHLEQAKQGDFPDSWRIALVRDSEHGKAFAYPENGKLPEFFEDVFGVEVFRIPQRFHDEVNQQASDVQ